MTVPVGRQPFWVVDVTLDRCSLSYGISPCTAQLGATGLAKCFNTRATCQDSDNYTPADRTYRFCSEAPNVPKSLGAFPFVQSVSIQPTKLSIGSGLGERGVATIVMQDGLHGDVGTDPYLSDRGYNPLRRGTFWGRFLARNKYFLGRRVVIRKGYIVDGEFDEREARTYFMEKAEGPSGGTVTITAKDALKLADDDRALAPSPSTGRLLSGITAAATSATLTPTGVGNEEYEGAGKIRINSEVISFTRSGDTLTLTRAQNNTTAAAHDAGDAVQECLSFAARNINDIARELLTDYAGLTESEDEDDEDAHIYTPDWTGEDALYNVRQYTALITEPTGVNKLLTELCENGPAYIWWDDSAGKVRYRALRPANAADLELNDDQHFLAGTVAARTRLDLRESQVVVNFGQRDPTRPLDEASNYRVSVVRVGLGATIHKYGQTKTKTINSRWITAEGRSFAEQVADAHIQRYDEGPRQLDFTLTAKDGGLSTGDLFVGRTQRLQGADGLPEAVVFQVLSRGGNDSDQFKYVGLEERYIPSLSTGKRIVVYAAPDYLNANLREDHDALYSTPTGAVTVECYIEDGTILGSSNTTGNGFTIGDWPVGTTITVFLRGRIHAAGGKGGNGEDAGDTGGSAGSPGGVALYTRFPITIDCTTGTPEIWGGGGGGGGGDAGNSSVTDRGGGGGGGGSGAVPGVGGIGGITFIEGKREGSGRVGTAEVGGLGGSGNDRGGHGGDPGQAGEAGPSGGKAGGAAGAAIDGVSYITFDGSADIKGAQTN